MRRFSALISILAVLVGLLAGGLIGTASAQEPAADLAQHPLTGVWLAMANPPLPDDPQIAVPSFFGADGTVVLMFPLTQAGQNGVQYNSAYVGTWVADGPRRGHFTATSVLSDAAGTFLGTVTVDGYPVVSEDGQTFIDDGSLVMVTIREPAGAIVAQFPGAGARPVTAIRMGGGSTGFPEVAPPAASPAP